MTRYRHRKGLILVFVLWITVILTVVCLSLAATVFLNQSSHRIRRRDMKVRQAMGSGLARAKASLLEDSAAADTSADQWCTATGFGFSQDGLTVSVRSDGGGTMSPGLSDESARINANVASAEVLARLSGMSRAAADAFVSLRQRASEQMPAASAVGEIGPFTSDGELAMALSLSLASTVDDSDGVAVASAGEYWCNAFGVSPDVAAVMRHLTVYTRQRNVDSQGRKRVNINEAGDSEITDSLGEVLTAEQIEAILKARSAEPYGSTGELLTRPLFVGDGIGPGTDVSISPEQLAGVIDRITTTSSEVIVGLVNVNTASAEVIGAISGLDQERVDAILAHRESVSPDELGSIGWLLQVLTPQEFVGVCSRVATRSAQFRAYVVVEDDSPDVLSHSGRNGAPPVAAVGGSKDCALMILERDQRRCSVLLWMDWRQSGNAVDN